MPGGGGSRQGWEKAWVRTELSMGKKEGCQYWSPAGLIRNEEQPSVKICRVLGCASGLTLVYRDTAGWGRPASDILLNLFPDHLWHIYSSLLSLLFKIKYVFIWMLQVLVAGFGILVP